MSINRTTSGLSTLTELANEMPSQITGATLARWIRKGLGPYKLDAITLGGREFSTMDAIDTFLELTTDDKELEAVRERAGASTA